jgi:hypothetical protein
MPAQLLLLSAAIACYLLNFHALLYSLQLPALLPALPSQQSPAPASTKCSNHQLQHAQLACSRPASCTRQLLLLLLLLLQSRITPCCCLHQCQMPATATAATATPAPAASAAAMLL